MSIENEVLATRLRSWIAFFTNEIHLMQLKGLPLKDTMRALTNPPAWVTVDPLPIDGSITFEDVAWACGDGDIDLLLSLASDCGDEEVAALGRECDEWQWRYMAALNEAEEACAH